MDKSDNLVKLQSFLKLEEGWNGNKGAKTFSREFITKLSIVELYLLQEPNIFPLIDGGIQFIFKNNIDEDYIITFYEDKIETYNRTFEDRKFNGIICNKDIDKVPEYVNDFYRREMYSKFIKK